MKKIIFLIVILMCAINSNSKIKASSPMDPSRTNLIAGTMIVTGGLISIGAIKLITKINYHQKSHRTIGKICVGIAGLGGALAGKGVELLIKKN